MISISANIIRLMRGDTLITPIQINLGSKLHPEIKYLGPDDNLYFALMEPNQAFEDAVVKKVYSFSSETDDDGNTLLVLEPEDTEKLLVGKYYYMIKLKYVGPLGKHIVKTIVPPTLFWLQGNNAHKTNYVDSNPKDITEISYDGGVIPDDYDSDEHVTYDGGLITDDDNSTYPDTSYGGGTFN